MAWSRVMAMHVVSSLLIGMASAGTATECNSLVQLSRSMPTRTNIPDVEDTLNRSETDFITEVLTSFGKQAHNYTGPQTLLGFRSKTLVDEQGMFAFDDSVKSIGIDIGAANNPLIFDMDKDASQVVLAFEPVFYQQLGDDMERVAREVSSRGGCKSRWEGFCANQRLVVFPSAVSSEMGHAKFRLAANPYCSSLNEVPGGLDPTLVNSPDKEVRDVMASCWGSLNKAPVKEVPTVTLASILSRIPKHIRVKYLKIDAQGQDFKILLSAGDHMSRIEYVRFEMQVDPPPGRKMVADIPSYAEVLSKMKELGFVHASPMQGGACNFDAGSSPFSKAIEEKECIFCRKLPCREGGVPPFGDDPRKLVA